MEIYGGTQSDFNMGLAILERINGYLNEAALAKTTKPKDFETWRDCLVTISGEIEDTYTSDQEEKFLSLLRSINPLIIKSKPRYVFGSHTPKVDITPDEFEDLFLKLRELDKFIRLMLNQRNMLLKKSRDVTKAAGRMS